MSGLKRTPVENTTTNGKRISEFPNTNNIHGTQDLETQLIFIIFNFHKLSIKLLLQNSFFKACKAEIPVIISHSPLNK